MSVTGPAGPRLQAATELVAAMLLAEEPGFYWSAVERVMADVTSGEGGPDALAELIFGFSSLGALLAARVARHTGEEPACVLRSLTV